MSNAVFNKASVTAALFSVLSAELCLYFKKILVPLAIMLLAMVFDYVTGSIRAFITKELNSKKGIIGILKKFAYIIVVVVGMIADYLCTQFAETLNLNLSFMMPIALILSVWLTINELISILENLRDIGIPMPKFLNSLILRLKNSLEDNQNGN